MYVHTSIRSADGADWEHLLSTYMSVISAVFKSCHTTCLVPKGLGLKLENTFQLVGFRL